MTDPRLTIEAQALALFDHYAEMSKRERAAALAALEKDQPALGTELAKLLAMDEQASPFDTPPAHILTRHQARLNGLDEATREDARTGTRFGAWQIDQVIGWGGMGTVYRAHRTDGQYEQTVALKCIRTEVSSDRLIAAFHNERNLLAQLNHPAIVALIDGGVEPNGQPWFAMPYVNGLPIDQWCDERRLPLRERIRLLLQVCDAMAYAHGQLVLHQDIKPSNILVDAQGHPKLLDFGLSSLLSADGGDTLRGFTSDYAAPEIQQGAKPSIAMDVYALGVVLYRLLCDQMPVNLQGRIELPGQHIETPYKPSELVAMAPPDTAQRRELPGPAALSRQLGGSLDSIALKCVAPLPAQRYAGIAELKSDLEHWLGQRPVLAHRPSRRYRTMLFLRRHRLAASLAALVVIALSSGLALALWQQQQASRQAASADAINRLFEQTLGSAAISGMTHVPLNPQRLLLETETRLRSNDTVYEPDTKARAFFTLARSYAAIGQYEHAITLANEARTFSDNRLQSKLADATLASLWNTQSRFRQAEIVANAALQTHSLFPGTDEQLADLGLRVELATALWGEVRQAEARKILDDTIGMLEHLGQAGEVDLIEALTLRAGWNMQFYQQGLAKQDLDRAMQLAQRNDNILLIDAVRYQLIGTLINLNRGQEALTLAKQLLDSRNRTLGPTHPETGRAWSLLSKAELTAGDAAASYADALKAQEILRAAFGQNHPEYALTLIRRALAGTTVGKETNEQGLQEVRDALAIMARAYGPDHPATIAAEMNVAALQMYLVPAMDAATARPRLLESLSLFRAAIAASERTGRPAPLLHGQAAGVLVALGQPEDAIKETRLALDQSMRLFGPGSLRTVAIRLDLADQLISHGDLAEAQTEAESTLSALSPFIAEAWALYYSSNAHRTLANLAMAQKHPDQAKIELRIAIELMQKTHAYSTETAELQKQLDQLH